MAYAEVTLSAGVILWKQQDFRADLFERSQREARGRQVRVRLDSGCDAAIRRARRRSRCSIWRRSGWAKAWSRSDWEVSKAGVRRAWFRGFVPAQARDRGLRLTCHAGETTDAQSVWDALAIGAERIGHGIRAIEDPRLVEHLREKNIPLEVCITSNVRTGAVASLAEHPVRRLFDAGVPIILNTDDPALFACSLRGEYEIAQKCFGFSPAEIEEIRENAFRYAFV